MFWEVYPRRARPLFFICKFTKLRAGLTNEQRGNKEKRGKTNGKPARPAGGHQEPPRTDGRKGRFIVNNNEKTTDNNEKTTESIKLIILFSYICSV